LAFDINPGSVLQQAMAAFQSQLPGMNIDFADQSDQLAKRTAAMGRTGSGLFNRDTGYISDRARAQREGMLGNLSFDASKSDQAASLQAQIAANQMREQQEGRFANVGVANMQSANQLAGLSSQNALQAAMANQGMNLQAGMANQSTDLQSQMSNIQNSMHANQFNAGQQNQVGMNNQMWGNQAQMQNIQNAIQQNMFGAGFDASQQGRQDMMANQANQDFLEQLRLSGQFGFGGNPTDAMLGSAHGVNTLAGQWGANATNTGNQAAETIHNLTNT